MSYRRILGRVEREEFVGRERELDQVVRHPSRSAGARGLLLLAAPSAGASEVLRQAFDGLFAQRSQTIPIYFALGPGDRSPVETARRFFQTFLQQFIAYRRADPSLCDAPLSLNDLGQLSLPADSEWIEALIRSFEHDRGNRNEQETIRFCFSAPHRAAAIGRTIFPMVDTLGVANHSATVAELNEVLAHSVNPYALAGPRRQLLDLIPESNAVDARLDLERLVNGDARRLLELVARRYEVEINGPTCDLIVQQLGASPYFIDALVRSARASDTPLTTFLNCQRVYVDEVMGGKISRYFDLILDGLSVTRQTRKNLIEVLYESLLGEERRSLLSAWEQRLDVGSGDFERLVTRLHISELANVNGAHVEIAADNHVWHDYLRANYLQDIVNEPRAQAVADTLTHVLKRAPRAMARKYRREAALGLRELLAEFNCQTVSAKLFHYEQFAESYKGLGDEEVNSGLDADGRLIRVPQVISVAACTAFTSAMECDEERCVVAHAFAGADYTDASELVLIAAEVDSKLEAGRELTLEWLDRLTKLATERNLPRARLWLVTPEGFSPDACELLKERGAYGSSHRQVEMLTARLKSATSAKEERAANEYELVVPMGDDTELIAANAIEQIARKAKFSAAQINQIKTALVEASINAAEHSLSPDRKLYHRFRLEPDRLVITVASRGVVPASLEGENEEMLDDASGKTRRGWGLKLIKTLMDEVEFQRVDDGTELRMVKYVRKPKQTAARS